MYQTNEKEKEFFEQKSNVTTETLKDLSDRDLLEKQTIYLENLNKSNNRIKANLQYWFYLSLIALGIVFFKYLK